MNLPCICIPFDFYERFIACLPELLHIAAIVMAFLMSFLFISGVLVALLDSWVLWRLAEFIRGEKRKRKNDEL